MKAAANGYLCSQDYAIHCYVSKVEFERSSIKMFGVWVSMHDWIRMTRRLNQERNEA